MGVFLFVIICVSIFTKKPEQKLVFEQDETATINTKDFDSSFFETVPKPKEEVEVVEKPVETKKPEVKRDYRQIIAQRKRIKADEAFEDSLLEEKLTNNMMADIYLAKIHQKSATQIWADSERFEEEFKNQPIMQLKRKRAEKDKVFGAFGDVDEFCDVGKGDCDDATKPTNLEWTILGGTKIRAILLDEVNSDVPDTVCQALVTQDVTGFHGNNILIPKGSVATCLPKPVTDPKQTRLHIAFTNIVTPNGVRIEGLMGGGDKVGSGGVQGIVNTKLAERLGFPMLTAMLPVTMAYTLPAAGTEDEERRNSAIESITNALQPIINSELDRGLRTVPNIKLKAGQPLHIRPFNNLVFHKPRGGKIMPTWQ